MATRRSSATAIAAVVLAELAAAVAIAFFVAQGYLAYECSDPAFRAEHAETCEGGWPYPLF
jgi:hypothetical protein